MMFILSCNVKYTEIACMKFQNIKRQFYKFLKSNYTHTRLLIKLCKFQERIKSQSVKKKKTFILWLYFFFFKFDLQKINLFRLLKLIIGIILFTIERFELL